MTFDGFNLFVSHDTGSIYSVNKDDGEVKWRQAGLKHRRIRTGTMIGDYIIYGEEITYLRNKQKVFSNGKTKAIIKSQYIVDSKNVSFNVIENILSSEENTTVNDQKSNFYYLEEFNLNINEEVNLI